ncbi:MAG: glycosyltransferase, partial [Alphaproteobacteria bacterium]
MTETAEPQDPRHIALFLPSLRGGGAERVMVLLANGFAARGHRVDLVLARAEGPYLDEVAAGVRIVDLARSRVLTSLWPLVRYLRRERPDAMLSAMTHANVIAIWAKMLARVPLRLVVSEHSSPSRSHAGGGMARIMRLLVRRFYGKADTIVCVSNGARDEMAALYPALSDRLTTIYNPLDLDRIQRLMEEPVSHPWLEDRDIPVVLAAGRLTAAKDYPTLLRAMAHLLGQRPARLIILGQG